MREIKFRGFNGEKWLYGNLAINYKTKQATISDDRRWRHPVRFYTVGQYTGLKDATGKEIYEGDIIKTQESEIGIIVWENDLGGFRARLADNSFYTLTAFFASMFSVIGNIYDNPELLEATVGGRP